MTKRSMGFVFLAATLLVGLVATSAVAQTSRLLAESVRGEDVYIELQSGGTLRGVIDVVGEDAVIFRGQDGRVMELRLQDMTRVSVVPATPGTQPGVQPGPAPGVQPGPAPGVQPGPAPGTSGYMPRHGGAAGMYAPEPGSREFEARYNAQLDRHRRATRVRNWGIAQLVGSFVLTGVGGAIIASCPYDSYYYYERNAGCVAGGATLVYIGSGLMFPIGIVMTPLGAARRGNARRELELLDSLGPRADFGPLVLPGGGGARVSLRF